MKIIYKYPKKYQNIKSGAIKGAVSRAYFDKDDNLVIKLTNIKEVKEDVSTKITLPFYDISNIIGKQFIINLNTEEDKS